MNTERMFVPLKALVPQRWRPVLRRLFTRLRHAGWQRHCNICGARLRAFLAHGIPPEADFRCPSCHSKPPHRLSSLFLESHPHIFIPGGLLLHIAPEPGLSRLLMAAAGRAGMRYRNGGLNGVGEQHLDLLQLPFADSSVHLMYCCHVLNSLQDDNAAMREVRRVMHPQGLALLQVPAFHRGDTTLETNGLEERMAAFGDDGIYRCYTNEDYEARLRRAGFEVSSFRADDLPAGLIQRHALKHEVLHLCRPAPIP